MINLIFTLLARILIGGLFILSGLSKMGDSVGSIEFIQSHGLPIPAVLHHLSVIVEVFGGLMLIVGFRPKFAAFCLILFLVPVTGIFHLLPALDVNLEIGKKSFQFIQVLKNAGIIGALMLIVVHGTGTFSISKSN